MKVGVIGASGYVGGELLRLLVVHPDVELSVLTSRQNAGEYVHRIHPSLKGFINLTFSSMELDKLTKQCDLIFVSVPHGNALNIVKELYSTGIKIVDLSADFRLKNADDYVNGMVGNILILICFPNQFTAFRRFIEIKSKMHN